jgi:hypothetical protein
MEARRKRQKNDRKCWRTTTLANERLQMRGAIRERDELGDANDHRARGVVVWT